MIEIHENLYIGNQRNYEGNLRELADWSIIHACKEPYHREALGYTGGAASRNHPEYLIAKRGERLILNLVDADDVIYISDDIINEAISFIRERLNQGKKVLVHCNQDLSRSATIGLMFLASIGYFNNKSFEKAESVYKGVYQNYNPALGMRNYARNNWEKFMNNASLL